MPRLRQLAAIAFALAPSVALASEGGGGGAHGPDVMTLVWQGVNLLLLIGALVWFGRGPIRDFFAGRRREIGENLDRAAALLGEAEGKVREWERRLTRLDAEVGEIRRSARERAEAESRRILADAEASASRIRADAVAAVDQEARRARQSLRAEAAQLAIDLATDLLRQHVSDADRKRLVDEFIVQVEAAPTAAARS